VQNFRGVTRNVVSSLSFILGPGLTAHCQHLMFEFYFWSRVS